jgi:cytochrome c peroxidase
MHNGRLMSLFEVVKFYAEGGDVPLDREHNPDKHPEIVPFKITNEQTWALVFFLHCLTDPRVTCETGEFDHPELRVVNGYNADFSENIIHVPLKP